MLFGCWTSKYACIASQSYFVCCLTCVFDFDLSTFNLYVRSIFRGYYFCCCCWFGFLFNSISFIDWNSWQFIDSYRTHTWLRSNWCAALSAMLDIIFSCVYSFDDFKLIFFNSLSLSLLSVCLFGCALHLLACSLQLLHDFLWVLSAHWNKVVVDCFFFFKFFQWIRLMPQSTRLLQFLLS